VLLYIDSSDSITYSTHSLWIYNVNLFDFKDIEIRVKGM